MSEEKIDKKLTKEARKLRLLDPNEKGAIWVIKDNTGSVDYMLKEGTLEQHLGFEENDVIPALRYFVKNCPIY